MVNIDLNDVISGWQSGENEQPSAGCCKTYPAWV